MFRFNAVRTFYLRNNARIRKCSNMTEKEVSSTIRDIYVGLMFRKIYFGLIASGFLFFPSCCSKQIQKEATNKIHLFVKILEYSIYGAFIGLCSPLFIPVLFPYGFYELAVRTNIKLNNK